MNKLILLIIVSFAGFGFSSLSEIGWIEPSKSGTLPAEIDIPNQFGKLGYVLTDGEINMKDHPFFEPLGSNGRACVTCHQPKDAMSVSVESLQKRWKETNGKDPIFAAIDGSDNPKLPQELESSHSLLLKRGLFRIALPYPAKMDNGKPVNPEFTIEVVSDPTGVNIDPDLGLKSKNPTISVFRRPRVVANMKYVMSPDPIFNIKTGTLAVTDPETGLPVGMNMMADSRHYTQKQQAVDAYFGHLEGHNGLTPAQQKQIVDFENKLFMAQSHDKWGSPLVEKGEPAGLGPKAMQEGNVHILANNNRDPIFHWFNTWKKPASMSQHLTAEQKTFRESVARGNDIFMFREFWINDVTHINSLGLGNPVRRTCATCHNGQMTAQDLAPGWVDLGTTNYPTWTENTISNLKSDLPIFKCTCNKDAQPHPYLGRVIYTTDPGRALISGKCIDIGSIVMQQFRGLAARPPYFSNGSAKTLLELVDYYDRRFNMKLNEQEKTDLVNFLSVL
ncbi:MAG: hypothetical protein U0Y10_22310 [Spirosomataceae bacterium]